MLVTEQLSEQGLELLRKDFGVDVRTDLTGRDDLVAEIGPYDALIIRSATQVTADVLEAAGNLKVVARAGIGLDNVDVDAATRRGVMVVNAPQSNVLSAAEQTLALLLAQARNIPQAHAALSTPPGSGQILANRAHGGPVGLCYAPPLTSHDLALVPPFDTSFFRRSMVG